MTHRETSQGLLNSTGAATFSQVWRMAVIFLTHMVLRRLVAPGDWGIWHWSEPLFLLLGQVRDLGLPGHVVRMKPRPYGNFLGFELIWGSVMAVAVFFGAPILAQGYPNAPAELVPVLQALTLFLFFEGLAKVPLTFFEAELMIGRSVLAEVLRNLTFAVMSITLAYQGYGVWSFIVAHVTGAGVFALVLWWSAWKKIPLTWVPGIHGSLLRTSLPLALMSILVLLTGKIDPLVLGLRFSEEEVGIYGLALYLAFLIAITVALPVSRALYPALTRLREDLPRFFEAYHLATLFILCIEVLFALVLFFNAEAVLLIFGGSKYVVAAPLLRILCFAPLCQPFGRCAGDVLLNLHRDRLLIIASLMTLFSLVGVGYYLTGFLGPAGMAWVNLVPLGTVVTTWAVYQVAPRKFWLLGRDLLQAYLLPVPLFLLAYLLPVENLWWRLVLFLGVSGLAGLVYIWRFHRPYRRFFRQVEP